MKYNKIESNGISYLIINGGEIVLENVQSALDIISMSKYEYDCDRIIIFKENVSETFFDLKTNIAGEILQKFINYDFKIAIVGDFSNYSSKSLKDFIYECNSGKDIFFVENVEKALEKYNKI